jgi:hypothetical protein
MRKKFILVTAAVLPVMASVPAWADCPATDALRNQLVAQNTANISRVFETKNCALIPGVLAFNARANATVNRAMIRANCTPLGPQTSAAALEAALRQACGGN